MNNQDSLIVERLLNFPVDTSFFEYVGIAGLERMNSQILAWIFSGDNKVFNLEERLGMLNTLFPPQQVAELCQGSGSPCTEPDQKSEGVLSDSTAIEKVFTEFKYIDLVIKTDTRVVVIENKLKAREHGSQLSNYEKKLSELCFTKEKSNLYFLTLTGESPWSGRPWEPVCYDDVYNALRALLDRKLESLSAGNVYNFLLLRGYVSVLGQLITVKKIFLEHHRSFPKVFQEGSAAKSSKVAYEVPEEGGVGSREYLSEQNFITRCNLETLLQYMFLRKVIARVRKNVHPDIKKIQPYFDETRGTALVNIHTDQSVMFKGATFYLGIQFQGRTVKFVMETGTGKPKNLEDVKGFLKEFQRLVKGDGSEFKRQNGPRANAYASVSKFLPDNESWFDKEMDELVGIFTHEILAAFQRARDVVPLLEEWAMNNKDAGT